MTTTTKTRTTPKTTTPKTTTPRNLEHAEGCRKPAPRMVWDTVAAGPAWVCPCCWHSTATRTPRRP